MKLETLRFSLEVDLEIDGEPLSREELVARLIEALNDGMPSVPVHDGDVLLVFVRSWQYTEQARFAQSQGGK